MKNYKNFNIENCDGCKYFDFKSLNNYLEFEKPLYSIVAKRKTAKLIFMSPKQYIYRIAQGFGGLSYDDAIAYANLDDGTLVKKYADDMKNGDKFPIGYYTDGGQHQEGRHRALAAMELGVEQIPVVELTEIDNNDFLSFLTKYKRKTFTELNQIFIDGGFKNGITNLGYNDMMNYMKYNLEWDI